MQHSISKRDQSYTVNYRYNVIDGTLKKLRQLRFTLYRYNVFLAKILKIISVYRYNVMFVNTQIT